MLKIKRIYGGRSPDDGERILVERLWPRGISKEDAALDEWRRDLAPSTELREWYAHDPEKWDEFQRRYKEELEKTGKKDELAAIARRAQERDVTLVFATADVEHSNARCLEELIAEAA